MQLARASYRDAVLDRWYRGRLVLAGDAAHSMSPQLGQGVNMALLDAMALRDALRSEASIEAALARYQAQRKAHVRLYQFWSRWLTPVFQSDRDWMPAAATCCSNRWHACPVGAGTRCACSVAPSTACSAAAGAGVRRLGRTDAVASLEAALAES